MIDDTRLLAAVAEPLGNLPMSKDALDFVTSMEYDTRGCLTTVLNAAGSIATRGRYRQVVFVHTLVHG